MEDETRNPLAKAKELISARKFSDAAECYETAAAEEDDKKKAADYLKSAALNYDRTRNTEDAVRCTMEAARYLEKTEKAECFVDCFGFYVGGIAGLAYDCCFEWRGETDGSHDDDHDINQNLIDRYAKEAEKMLREALSVEGVKKNKILRLAKKEHNKMKKEGGWGAPRCLKIITSVTKE